MKLIVIMVMLSSLLFSWQKQIILGSYSVENNGKRALETINKQIQDDIQLQAFMKDHSLRTINTVISDYTVVSINAFESYTALLNTMNALKVYYGDAFVLKYPTKNIAQMEQLVDIEKKALEEQERLAKEDEVKRLELKKLLEEEALKEEVVQEARNEVVIVEPVVEETPIVPVAVSQDISDEDTQAPEYIMYLVALALLALLAAGITVYIISNKKTKSQEEDA